MQISLLFPGEMLRDAGVAPIQRNGVWNLCIRAMVLWQSSMRMRYDVTLDPQGRADFATNAWLEADAIETALNSHTCNLEAGTLYQAREYLFKCAIYDCFDVFLPTDSVITQALGCASHTTSDSSRRMSRRRSFQ